MKFVLPVAALAIIVSMALYTMFYEADDQLTVTFANSPTLSNDRSTIFPKFTIPTSDGRMFSVLANRAEAIGQGGQRIRMHGIKADLTGIEGTDIRMRAKTGLLNLEKQTITISGDVHVISDEGYNFRTEHVVVDIEKQTLHGKSSVTGTSPMGTIAARKFWLLDKGKRLKFQSGVVMNVISGKKTRPAKPRPDEDAELKGWLKSSLYPEIGDTTTQVSAAADPE